MHHLNKIKSNGKAYTKGGGEPEAVCDASLYKTRQSDEDNTLVCQGALTKYCKGINRSDNPDGGVAQLGEHLPCKQGVRSSILLISTTSEQSRQKTNPLNRICKTASLFFLFPKKAYGFPGGAQEE